MRLFLSPVAIVVSLFAVGLLAVGGCSGSSPRDGDVPQTNTGREARPNNDLARRKHVEAVGLIKDKKYEAAEGVLRESIEADVTFGPAHNSLGTVYFHQSKLYQAAWEFQYASKLMPYQSEPRNNLGLVFEQAGKLDDAIGWYQQAMSLEPDNPQLLSNLARARVRRGDREEDLRELLRNIVSKDSRTEWTDWAKERLQFLWRATPATMPS